MRERLMGDNSCVRSSEEFAAVGIQRRFNQKGEEEDDASNEAAYIVKYLDDDDLEDAGPRPTLQEVESEKGDCSDEENDEHSWREDSQSRPRLSSTVIPILPKSKGLPDLSHLLPQKGTLPTAKHARAVLSILSKKSGKVSLKDCIGYFESKTKDQKKNLQKIFKEVAFFSEEEGDIYLIG